MNEEGNDFEERLLSGGDIDHSAPEDLETEQKILEF